MSKEKFIRPKTDDANHVSRAGNTRREQAANHELQEGLRTDALVPWPQEGDSDNFGETHEHEVLGPTPKRVKNEQGKTSTKTSL